MNLCRSDARLLLRLMGFVKCLTFCLELSLGANPIYYLRVTKNVLPKHVVNDCEKYCVKSESNRRIMSAESKVVLQKHRFFAYHAHKTIKQ